ncbi:transposase [Xanthomonas theicola]|uniref:transposase n=1 Tax=Xanthomonas theicola TaxID=56464 RepID=UPI000FF875C7|nr:transposase [Xanthomonas theicola]QNH24647.1 transposase [Xanthomonas theicola]
MNLLNPSDEALEHQVLASRSVQRFLEIGHRRKAPDPKTISMWHKTVQEKGTDRRHSRGGERPTAAGRVHSLGGQILDVCTVSAPIQRNAREEDARLKQSEVPEG